MFSLGSGLHGQLGNGESSDETTPFQIKFSRDTTIIDISTGKLHSAVVSAESVHSCVNNN